MVASSTCTSTRLSGRRAPRLSRSSWLRPSIAPMTDSGRRLGSRFWRACRPMLTRLWCSGLCRDVVAVGECIASCRLCVGT
ncbi:unnamed protein product [Chondrus crispus]|uniref:Uncharacterized protein n=1 Tax=Chondrus crispus TaxID=2769 RepID=R7QIJ4_CHOCR|nr:unnamed protein product [Chondrus crispus]CDF37240.1 unnamed protein product [Chondrus crispus]|eukprot:XP_005717059.1 unnamed protein product [Chondrus crispus]